MTKLCECGQGKPVTHKINVRFGFTANGLNRNSTLDLCDDCYRLEQQQQRDAYNDAGYGLNHSRVGWGIA
jgi:hypothetical protein